MHGSLGHTEKMCDTSPVSTENCYRPGLEVDAGYPGVNKHIGRLPPLTLQSRGRSRRLEESGVLRSHLFVCPGVSPAPRWASGFSPV